MLVCKQKSVLIYHFCVPGKIITLNPSTCYVTVIAHSLIQFPEYDELYCNYSFVYGHDWAIVSVSEPTPVLGPGHLSSFHNRAYLRELLRPLNDAAVQRSTLFGTFHLMLHSRVLILLDVSSIGMLFNRTVMNTEIM